MENQLRWTHKLSGEESLGSPRWVKQYEPGWGSLRYGTSLLALWGEVWQRDNGSCSPWCQSLKCHPVYHWCLSSCYPSAGTQRQWVWVGKYVCGLRGTAWGSSTFFHWLNPHWFQQPEVVGTCLPGTGTLGWGTWCGAGTPPSRDVSPEFLSTTLECGSSLFQICALPTSLDGCIFFNSIVVRLPFNSISDSSEWWLFYILIVILMWLCKEASHVCLCCHLEQKSKLHFNLVSGNFILRT